MKIRVPYGRLDERLDAKSLWQLPNVLDDPEERLVCRELLSECHRVGMRGVGEVLMGLEGVEPALRRRLLDGLRKRLGFKTSDTEAVEEANARARVRGAMNSMWQACPACGAIPVNEVGVPTLPT